MPADPAMHLSLLLAFALVGCGSPAGTAGTTSRTPPMLEIGRPGQRPTAVVSLPRWVAPGTALSGRVPPGSRVTANDEDVPVAADGRIDWPLPAGATELHMRVQRPDGQVIVRRVGIRPR